MIQIALVDDDEAASNELQEKLQRFAQENHVSAWLSVYSSSPQSASSSLLLSLNNASVDLTGISLIPTGGWWSFVENDLLTLNFKKGYNLLSFYPTKTLYNFDVLTLKRVLQ